MLLHALKTMRRLGGPCLLGLMLVVACSSVASACPTCKDSLLHEDPEAKALVQGYFWSILFMMSMPFLIFCGLGAYFYVQIRKADGSVRIGADGLPVAPQRPALARPGSGAWEPAT